MARQRTQWLDDGFGAKVLGGCAQGVWITTCRVCVDAVNAIARDKRPESPSECGKREIESERSILLESAVMTPYALLLPLATSRLGGVPVVCEIDPRQYDKPQIWIILL